MAINKQKISHSLFYFAIFINFFGFYDALLLTLSAGLGQATTIVSIPVRSLSILAIMLLFFISQKNTQRLPKVLFLIFSAFYIAQIIVHALNGQKYHIAPGPHFLYFLAFTLLPVIFLSSIKLDVKHFNIARKGLFLSGFIFSILVLIFYSKYIGVWRVSSGVVDEAVLSPLILSYCSTMAIGVVASYWIEHKVSFTEKLYYISIILLSTLPFFLGASRGSIFSLFIPFIIIFAIKDDLGNKLKIGLFGFGVLAILLTLSAQLGTGVFDRFTGISSGIEEKDSSSIRIYMWQRSLEQFMNSPIFGSGFLLEVFNNYPHNIFIEALQNVGLLGFIPFVAMFIITLVKSIKIFKHSPKHSWISIIFIQSLMQNLFSGSIYMAGWLWFSAGLVLLFDATIKEKEHINEIAD